MSHSRPLHERQLRSMRAFSRAGLYAAGLLVVAFLLSLRWQFGHSGTRLTFGISSGALVWSDNPFPAKGWFWRPNPSFRLGITIVFWMPHVHSLKEVTIPIWIPTLIVLTSSVIVRQITVSPRAGVCRRCSYDLTGNVSGRCPECGCVTESLGEQ